MMSGHDSREGSATTGLQQDKRAMRSVMSEIADIPSTSAVAELSLLIVDDDRPFLTRLARAMEGRGYHVRTAETVADGVAAIEDDPPAFAVIDMRLADGHGLDVITKL